MAQHDGWHGLYAQQPHLDYILDVVRECVQGLCLDCVKKDVLYSEDHKSCREVFPKPDPLEIVEECPEGEKCSHLPRSPRPRDW